jgi:hypothetical protein
MNFHTAVLNCNTDTVRDHLVAGGDPNARSETGAGACGI